MSSDPQVRHDHKRGDRRRSQRQSEAENVRAQDRNTKNENGK